MDEQYSTAAGCISVIGIIVLIVMVITGGSFRTEVTYIPPNVQNVEEQMTFEEDLDAQHWLLGLIKGQQPDLQKAIAKYVRPGEQITKLTILTRHTWLDSFLSGITLFIYCPQTVTIKGTIAKK
jgi:hypothetical protein